MSKSITIFVDDAFENLALLTRLTLIIVLMKLALIRRQTSASFVRLLLLTRSFSIKLEMEFSTLIKKNEIDLFTFDIRDSTLKIKSTIKLSIDISLDALIIIMQATLIVLLKLSSLSLFSLSFDLFAFA